MVGKGWVCFGGRIFEGLVRGGCVLGEGYSEVC